ncbi:MAG TPA: hypothetical protein VGC18_00975 [Lacisediminihabitans sp.]|uniref:hypothetical protein n=1 Tax=Lacisediminihabitans sp. TaxID=2787631 RepID=UPI002ED92ED5
MTLAELPSWRGLADDPGRVLALIDAWATGAAMAELVAAFHGTLPEASGEAVLAWLDGFSAEHWDFRAGHERNLATRPRLDDDQERLALSLAAPLGLADRTAPSADHYDVVLMTGGMIRAGLVKPRFVAELIEAGLSVDRVVFLGGFRPFAGDELGLREALGVAGDNEFDAMVAGMDAAFGPLGAPEVDEFVGDGQNASWCEYRWETPLGRFAVLAAPSSEPSRRRANSADTFEFWARHRRCAGEGSALVVTTPIYVPYQGAAAVEILGLSHGFAVETVGTSDRAADLGELSQVFLPAHHLQELRSAIRAMRSLRAAVRSRRP